MQPHQKRIPDALMPSEILLSISLPDDFAPEKRRPQAFDAAVHSSGLPFYKCSWLALSPSASMTPAEGSLRARYL